jgi:hypothetical protein
MNTICPDNNKYSTYNENIPDITNNIARVSFAPFLIWNNHKEDYFNKIGDVNKMAINNNNINNNKCNNKKIDLNKKMDRYDPYDVNIYDENNEIQDTEILLKNTYYSQDNITYIQKRIIIKVYEDSDKQYRLRPQKYEIIIQVMNGIYETYCRHLPYNIKEQIEELNEKVIEYCSKLLLEETKAYYNYLRDIEPNKLNLLERPQYNSSKKVLKMIKNDIYNNK